MIHFMITFVYLHLCCHPVVVRRIHQQFSFFRVVEIVKCFPVGANLRKMSTIRYSFFGTKIHRRTHRDVYHGLGNSRKVVLGNAHLVFLYPRRTSSGLSGRTGHRSLVHGGLGFCAAAALPDPFLGLLVRYHVPAQIETAGRPQPSHNHGQL